MGFKTEQIEFLIIKNKKLKFKNNNKLKNITVNIYYINLYKFIIKKNNL